MFKIYLLYLLYCFICCILYIVSSLKSHSGERDQNINDIINKQFATNNQRQVPTNSSVKSEQPEGLHYPRPASSPLSAWGYAAVLTVVPFYSDLRKSQAVSINNGRARGQSKDLGRGFKSEDMGGEPKTIKRDM